MSASYQDHLENWHHRTPKEKDEIGKEACLGNVRKDRAIRELELDNWLLLRDRSFVAKSIEQLRRDYEVEKWMELNKKQT